MNENIYYAAFFFPSAAFLLAVLVKQVSTYEQAKLRLGHDEAYRDLATQAASAQAKAEEALGSVRGALADVQNRLAAVEKLLRAVD